MSNARDIEAEKRMLDKCRPSKTRTWPNNGLFYHLGLHRDGTWRAVVCATENDAQLVFGPDVEHILGAYAHMHPEDKPVWDAPGIEFVKVEFLPPLWLRRDEVVIQIDETKKDVGGAIYIIDRG